MAQVTAGPARQPRRAVNLLVSDMPGSPSRNKVGPKETQTLDGGASRVRRQMGAPAPQHIGQKWICFLRKVQKGPAQSSRPGPHSASIRGAIFLRSRRRLHAGAWEAERCWPCG